MNRGASSEGRDRSVVTEADIPSDPKPFPSESAESSLDTEVMQQKFFLTVSTGENETVTETNTSSSRSAADARLASFFGAVYRDFSAGLTANEAAARPGCRNVV